MALEDIENYFHSYDRSVYTVFACQGNEPSDEDIQAFEATIGFRLPDEFREFTKSPLGGLYLEVKEEHWPRPQLYQVGPFWSFLYGLKVFGIAADIPEVLDIRLQTAELESAGYGGLVPCLQVIGDANMYCFNEAGEIVLWDREVPEESQPISETFSELLLKEIGELEDRVQMEARGEDKSAGSGEIRPEFQKSYDKNMPCPHCGKPLRSNQAKQCFACGADWH